MMDDGWGRLSERRMDGSDAIRRRRRRTAAALILAAGIAAAVFLMIRIHGNSSNSLSLARIDQPLPSLTVDARGTAVDLKTIGAGARRVIVFYSPACRICREVLPGLQPFPDSLRLILANESADRDDSETAGFPNAVLVRDRWRVRARAFAVAALPTILFVDECGILRDGISGAHEPRFVRQRLKDFAFRHYECMTEKP